MRTIAVVQSEYDGSFGIPRQPGLTCDIAKIVMNPEYSNLDAFRGLEKFSHLWVLFRFDGKNNDRWKPLVTPPRLGGREKMGVFATRSPFRPNAIGLSAVELISCSRENERVVVTVRGTDLQNGSAVFDIKPYLPYSDCLINAIAVEMEKPRQKVEVAVAQVVKTQLNRLAGEKADYLIQLVKETLSLDPRPAYKLRRSRRDQGGICLGGLHFKWKFEDGAIEVCHVKQLQTDDFSQSSS